MNYNWQQPDWPEFRYEISKEVADMLAAFEEEVEGVNALLKAISGKSKKKMAWDAVITASASAASPWDECGSRVDIMPSLHNSAQEITTEDMAAMLAEVQKAFARPLTEAMLFKWHNKLLLGRNLDIASGSWRKHALQVASGPFIRPNIHFEAPPPSRLPVEMKKFVQWFNDTAPGAGREIEEGPVRAALAHLYFESLHPFRDCNGKVGRSIAEKAIAQKAGRPLLLSLHLVVKADKKNYYSALEAAQRGNEVSAWVEYFVRLCLEAQLAAKTLASQRLNARHLIFHNIN